MLQDSLSDNDKHRFEVIYRVASIKIKTWYRVVWYLSTDVSGGSYFLNPEEMSIVSF